MSMRSQTMRPSHMVTDDDKYSDFTIKALLRTDGDSKIGTLIENNVIEEAYPSTNQVQILEIQRNDIKFCINTVIQLDFVL